MDARDDTGSNASGTGQGLVGAGRGPGYFRPFADCSQEELATGSLRTGHMRPVEQD